VREYAKLGPTFWTGETGKELRRRGSEGVIVALYLVSSPHSNMLGLYYQPVLYMAHETGLGIEGASKGLRDCIEVGFCRYDAITEMVFVPEMAAWQIADELKATDKRCPGIQKDYDALPENPFLAAWFERYARPFHLKRGRTPKPPKEVEKPEVQQAPSMPHRSQEQEQEQEQEQDPPSGEREQGASQPTPPQADPTPPAPPPPAPPDPIEQPTARATRKCPASFDLTDELHSWAREKVRGVDLEHETAKFRDHTFARAISDWPGAWRNWMRKAFDDAQLRGVRNGTTGETPWQRSQRERVHEMTGGLASRKPPTAVAAQTTLEIDDVRPLAPRLG
jgi:hypothetical protein